VLGLKGGLWVCKKSQKISTASDQYFLSYVKKTTGGGQIDPPPSGNRVNLVTYSAQGVGITVLLANSG